MLLCKLKFAFIDILICILLIIGLLFLFFRPKGETVTGEYTLLLTVPSEYASCFSLGGEMLDGVGKGKCGVITSLSSMPSLSENSEGVYLSKTHVRLTVSVEGEARRVGDTLTFGTLSLLPGKRVYLHLPCVSEGVCLSVGEASRGAL